MDEVGGRTPVTVRFRMPKDGANINLDEQIVVCKIGPTSIVREVLCVGDQITFVNGYPVGSPEDAVHRLRSSAGQEVYLLLMRLPGTNPVSDAQLAAAGIRRRLDGFHYFFADLFATHPKSKLAVSIKSDRVKTPNYIINRIRVQRVEKDSIAEGILFHGDHLLAVDGHAVQNNVSLAKKLLGEKLQVVRKCTLLVERADDGSERGNNKPKPDPRNLDPLMAEDAAQIGMRQAKHHRRHCNDAPPKPILRRPPGRTNLKRRNAVKAPRSVPAGSTHSAESVRSTQHPIGWNVSLREPRSQRKPTTQGTKSARERRVSVSQSPPPIGWNLQLAPDEDRTQAMSPSESDSVHEQRSMSREAPTQASDEPPPDLRISFSHEKIESQIGTDADTRNLRKVQRTSMVKNNVNGQKSRKSQRK
ncbi:Protein C25G4.6 [Aphelenchoides avenae]|nr:Protein C25G4.6 [Aphelenchus avenae]